MNFGFCFDLSLGDLVRQAQVSAILERENE